MASKEGLLGQKPSVPELARHFLILGTTGFGGPAVHFSLFQQRFVEKLGWFSGERFMELMAMCNCLPGPSSTQTAFAIGIDQQGVLGGLASGLSFLLPSAIVMTVLGFLSRSLEDEVENPNSPENGFAIAVSSVGTALVFIAVTSLVKKVATGRTQIIICFGTAMICLVLSPTPAWLNPALILCGGLVSFVCTSAGEAKASTAVAGKSGLPVWAGACIFVLYFIVSGCTMYLLGKGEGSWIIPFLAAGLFVWGGGPVVLPFLMISLAGPPGSNDADYWISKTVFLTGIALAEMMPGPVFNISCFFGVQLALNSDYPWYLGTLWAWLGLVGPGVALTFAAMPLWEKLRNFEAYKRALPGLNAAAVGLLVSTVFLVYGALEERASKSGKLSIARAVALGAYAAMDLAKVGAPETVLVAGLLGVLMSFAH